MYEQRKKYRFTFSSNSWKKKPFVDVIKNDILHKWPPINNPFKYRHAHRSLLPFRCSFISNINTLIRQRDAHEFSLCVEARNSQNVSSLRIFISIGENLLTFTTFPYNTNIVFFHQFFFSTANICSILLFHLFRTLGKLFTLHSHK